VNSTPACSISEKIWIFPLGSDILLVHYFLFFFNCQKLMDLIKDTIIVIPSNILDYQGVKL
jgi:hypothetical protein